MSNQKWLSELVQQQRLRSRKGNLNFRRCSSITQKVNHTFGLLERGATDNGEGSFNKK